MNGVTREKCDIFYLTSTREKCGIFYLTSPREKCGIFYLTSPRETRRIFYLTSSPLSRVTRGLSSTKIYPPHPPLSSRCVRFIRIWPRHALLCPLSVYLGPASRARNVLGFTVPPLSPPTCHA